MRVRILGALVAACVLATASSSFAQTSEERATARELVKKRGDAVVMVLATIKLRVNMGGQERPSDQAMQANATVLDPSGLAVLSLQTLQPDSSYERQLSARMGGGGRVEVTSEIADLRMHLGDGRELPARLILKDEDLDLAFIRPTEPPPSPLAFVDMGNTSKPSLLDLLLVIQRTTETTGWMPSASFGTVQLVLDKPRTYYLVTFNSVGGGGLGSPLFDATGKFVGVMVMRDTGTRGSTSPGVLPAEDIREVAKQAPGK